MELIDKVLHTLGLSAAALLGYAQVDEVPKWLRIVAIIVVGGAGVMSQSLVRRPKPEVQPEAQKA